MDSMKLVYQYANAAEQHGIATVEGDYKSANRSHNRVLEALHRLDECEPDGRRRLDCLLGHSSSNVRVWAATHLLAVETERAIAALNEVAVQNGIIGGTARTVLSEWKNGTLRIP